MSSLERALRLAFFFPPFFAFIAWTGFRFLGVRLLMRLAPRAGTRVTRRMILRWNRAVTWWAKVAAGVSIEIEGAPPEGANLVIVSNHQSIVDIPLLIATFAGASPLFVAKEQMRWGVPNISPAARFAGYAFISRRRGDSKQFVEIERLGARLEPERVSALIFAEGTRSRDGALGPFKAGGLAALLRAAPRARVVPVALDGTFRAATFSGLFRDFPGLKIRVRIGPPIEVSPDARTSDDAVRALTERCRDFCAAAQASWRSTTELARQRAEASVAK